MRRTHDVRRGHRNALEWLPVALVVLAPAAAWLIVEQRGGTTADIAATTAVAVALAGLFEGLRDRRIRDRDARQVPQGPSTEVLESWRSKLRQAVVKERIDRQLHEMVGSSRPMDVSVREVDGDPTRPRLLIRGALRPWDELKRESDDSGGRLVVLGDPGYGKTVAALTLLAHINRRDSIGRTFAELFSLADWYRWQADTPGGLLADWLAYELSRAYPMDLPASVAGELIAEGLLLPILDGLDEIPTEEHRRTCVDAIEAYTRPIEPHRPFVLTCRGAEYSLLRPDFLEADGHVALVGLEHEQVMHILEDRTGSVHAWHSVRTAHANDHPTLVRLFRSPLRLTTALQAYSRADPSELLALDFETAKARLWERLLETHGGSFRGSSGDEAARWLAFLARGLRRTGRQRFVLHELYLMDPLDGAVERRFRIVLAAGLAAVAALLGILAVGLAAGLLGACAYGAQIARSFERVPSIRVADSWTDRLARARTKLGPSTALLAAGGALAGGALAVQAGATAGLVVAGGALAVYVGVMLMFTLREGIEPLSAGPPENFAGKRLDATLAESRDQGLLLGLICGAFYGLATGLVSTLTSGLAGALIFAAAVALSGIFMGSRGVPAIGAVAGALAIGEASATVFGGLVGCAVGLLVALRGGFGAWCYHYWLRLSLSRRSLLPIHLRGFLSWCAGSERGWLRLSDACEFRHRELLEFLSNGADVVGSS